MFDEDELEVFDDSADEPLRCPACGGSRFKLFASGIYCADCGDERGELVWTDVMGAIRAKDVMR